MKIGSTLGPLLPCLFLLAPLSAPGAEPFNERLANPDVIAMSRAGLAPQLIIAKVQSSANAFDLSTRGMIALKENGVRDEVIHAMMAAAENRGVRSGPDLGRLGRELENLASGAPAGKAESLAWLAANRGQLLPHIRRSLSEAKPEIRAGAILALARFKDGESLPAMRSLLTDISPVVRQADAQALFELNDPVSLSAAEQAVARQLQPTDGYARLLGYAKLTRSAASLARLLETGRDPNDRAAAAWALGEIGRVGTAGRPALEKALSSDPIPRVRREAALAIAKFHDAKSAAALQNACRQDPEVRKTTLAALADYPEATEFLVGVMNLGSDQIAADELEMARASLVRLTGEDYALDGSRWSKWFAESNRVFPVGSPIAGNVTPSSQGILAPAPTVVIGGENRLPGPGIDVEAWSIVADSTGIPMAPQIDVRGPVIAPGGVALPLPSDFAVGQVGGNAFPGGAVTVDSGSDPSFLPTGFLGAGQGEDEAGRGISDLRTWSSASPASPASPPAPQMDRGWSEIRPPPVSPVSPPELSGNNAPPAFVRPPEATDYPVSLSKTPSPEKTTGQAEGSATSLPVAGVVAPITSVVSPDAEEMEFLRGLSLPMPPGESSADGGRQASNSLPGAPDAPIAFSEPSDDFSADSGRVGAGALPAAGGDALPFLPELSLDESQIPVPDELLAPGSPSNLADNPPDRAGSPPEPIPGAYSGNGGGLFVEPAPGQLVIGEPLAGPGEALGPDSDPGAWSTPFSSEAMPAAEGRAEDFLLPPPFPESPVSPVPETTSPPTESLEASSSRDNFPPAPNAFVPAPPAPEPEPFDPFKGTSMPPVINEGLILPRGSGGLPPLLGENPAR
ncbi:MAG: HEAT repeat domain-containing protein [Planctomycetota bacterium]|jgi:HEAT repeat protein|nr:HEAT repeat domain-containing protein [Planctomycetota bacterium]